MKIKLSKSQWETMGKQAGWMKVAQPAPSMAQQIGTAFEGLAGGVKEVTANKAKEYAQRIMNGEPREKVLEGLGQSWVSNVDKLLAQMSQSNPNTANQPQQNQQPQAQQKQYTSQQIIDWSRSAPMNYQKAIARILRDNDAQQIQTLNKAVSGDAEARKWLGEYSSQVQ